MTIRERLTWEEGDIIQKWNDVFPNSPDGTDWGIYGETPKEQWEGVEFEAYVIEAHVKAIHRIQQSNMVKLCRTITGRIIQPPPMQNVDPPRRRQSSEKGT